MATVTVKPILDTGAWRMESNALAASAAGTGFSFDLRNDASRHPEFGYLRSATALDKFDPRKSAFLPLASPALAGTFGAGATIVRHPSQGPRGTLAAGGTISKIILTTALPAAVAINQLANRCDGNGFKIRIIGKASGKVEERTIIGNTAGTTPTIWLNTALSFAPAAGDGYEILSGRDFMLSAGTTAAGSWKYYDYATNSISGNLSTTNLPATIATDSNAMALSEQHVSNDRKPGEGFISGGATSDTKNCIQATAATATTISGSGMPATLVADEYRNFQVRIVEDTVTPTAVGQRSRISTHTSGATGVFTCAAFTVTPSASAKFVVENDDDKILLRSSATALVYNYNITANTWDTTTWAAPVAHGAGVVLEQSFGITRDINNNARHSHIYCLRGGASSAIDVLDIAGAATGSWSNDIAYANKAQTFTTGTCAAYDPITFNGKYLHINVNGTQQNARFDMLNRAMELELPLDYPQGTAIVGGKLALACMDDGVTKLAQLYNLTGSQTAFLSLTVAI